MLLCKLVDFCNFTGTLSATAPPNEFNFAEQQNEFVGLLSPCCK